MPKRIRKRRPADVSQWAHQIVKESVQDEAPIPAAQISKVMAQMGRKGGKIGGKRRMVTMTPEERSRVALKAAKSRWAKK